MDQTPSQTEADINLITEECRKVLSLVPNSIIDVPATPYAELEENPLLGARQSPLLLRPGSSNFDLSIFSASWIQENEPSLRFSVFSTQTQHTQLETVPSVVSRLSSYVTLFILNLRRFCLPTVRLSTFLLLSKTGKNGALSFAP